MTSLIPKAQLQNRALLVEGRELEGVLALMRSLWLDENSERRASASAQINDIKKRAME